MIDLGADHQELLQFLYAAPVGLMHLAPSGEIEMMNPASARWLLRLTEGGKLVNLFTALARVAPGLRDAVAQHGPATGVIADSLRFEVPGARRRDSGAEYIALTLSRLDTHRLMVVITDISQQVRDEQALSDREAHYRAVVSVLSEGIVVHDAQGRLLLCNAAAERMLGAPPQPLLPGTAMAQGWVPCWPNGQDIAARETPTAEVLAGGAARERVPLFAAPPGGEGRWFEVSAQPVIRPGSGELLAVVTSIADVTQRQRLQDELLQHREHLQDLVAQRTRALQVANAALSDQQRLSRAVADAVPGMIGYWDAQLRCRFANEGYLEWFGRAPESLLGLSMVDVLGAELFEKNRSHVEAALRGERQHFQRTIRKPDGTTGHTLASYIPDIVAGQVMGFNVVVSDVTELKEAEFQLATLNEQLQRRALQADDASRAKSAFLANMSHEIRTPMNAIIGLSHLMQREAQEPLQQARLHKIHDASQHLLQLINDILDLSKIEAGKMTLDDVEFDTQQLLGRALDMVGDAARQKGLPLVPDGDALPRRLRGDPVRLSQCLINLLTNAVKFTERGVIALRAQVQDQPPDGILIRFEVQDTGPGIAADQLPLLFNAFEQADNSSTRQHGGTGLGLALTRHFARLMGGDAGASSMQGAGSTFWFTAELKRVTEVPVPAPLDGPPPRAQQSEPDLRRALLGRRVLLAEDNPINREVAVELLQLAGLAVETAVDGAAAVEMARARAYDVILMDMQMPVMDGLAATREIRRAGDATPILAMTANAFGDDRQACLAAGMVDHVAKPVNPEALYAALLRWMAPPVSASAPCPLASAAPADSTAGFSARVPVAELSAAAERAPLRDRLAAVPGLDADTAWRTVGGDELLLARVLQRFVEVYTVAEGESTLGAGEPAVSSLLARSHSLRGACASIGARAMQADLAQFEATFAHASEAASCWPRARELDAQLGVLVRQLTVALDAVPPQG